MSNKTPISIAYGDGIGPEIMEATLGILRAANAQIEPEIIEIGEKIYLQGFTSGIPASAWESLKRTKVLLKSPITTPQGGGYKSLNVTLRKTLGLYANVRPCISYPPYIPTKFPNINLVIIRENEEDTYSGIEYRESDDVYICTKIITRQGCERVIRYAFEYAQKLNRKKVTCLSKDNIMKMTDGLFHQIFNQIAAEYPAIEHNHFIVDIGTALIATQPERFDVIVTLNLYGDIISDVAAQVAGSVGLAGSANIGTQMAMFEAIHGSAPDIAGKNMANPSGLLNAAAQMLIHIHQSEIAALIENAWLKTIEDGIHTSDIYSPAYTKKKVGTQEFAQAVIARLGQMPSHFKPVEYKPGAYINVKSYGEKHPYIKKELVGVDVYCANDKEITIDDIVKQIESCKPTLQLTTISSKGLKIWPNSSIENPFLGQFCCRFQLPPESKIELDVKSILALLAQLDNAGFSILKSENLYLYNGQLGFSLLQGE